VIAGVLAVLLAAGGGYGGYQFVLSRPVKVEYRGMSVEVPRAWSQKAENQDGPRLLVADNTASWLTSPTVEGVYMELRQATKLPTTGSPPQGCTSGPPDGGQIGDQQLATFQYACGSRPSVIDQYRQVNGTTLLRIEVRDDDPAGRQAVLDSVSYHAP
jgi:hypothetical protein